MAKKKKKSKQFLTQQLHIPASWVNKFTIVGLMFFVWIAFFDDHNLINSYKISQGLKQMEAEKQEQIEKIAEAKKHWKDLENNKEKFAREKYFMHKEDEEIFIIEKTTK